MSSGVQREDVKAELQLYLLPLLGVLRLEELRLEEW